MATITELTESGVGSFLSFDGGEASRLFLVQSSFETDNAVEAVETEIPFGRPHNKPRFANYKSFSYHEVEWVNPTSRRVLVIYRPETDPAFSGWVTEVEFSAETEEIFYDVQVTPEGGLPTSFVPRKFETPAFRLKPWDGTGQLSGFLVKSTNGKLVPVERLGPLIPQPQQVRRSTMTFAMSRRLTVMTWKTIRGVANRRTTVNSVPFIDFPARTVLFSNFGMTESFGSLGRATSGFIYDVRLQFIYNPKGWSPIELLWSYTDDGGEFKSPILFQGGAVPADADFVNEFLEVGVRRNIYGESDFYGILNDLGRVSPPALSDRRGG